MDLHPPPTSLSLSLAIEIQIAAMLSTGFLELSTRAFQPSIHGPAAAAAESACSSWQGMHVPIDPMDLCLALLMVQESPWKTCPPLSESLHDFLPRIHRIRSARNSIHLQRWLAHLSQKRRGLIAMIVC